jgi:hypothetical protein
MLGGGLQMPSCWLVEWGPMPIWSLQGRLLQIGQWVHHHQGAQRCQGHL